MDVLVDWESIPWKELQEGERYKSCVRDGQDVWLCEVTDAYAPKEWCTSGHLFYVVAGEATLRLRDGDKAVRLRAGDTGILLAGEANAHNLELAAGESIQMLFFEQE